MEACDEFVERLLFETFKVVIDALAGIAESFPVGLRSRADGAGSQIENMLEKFIRVLRRDAIFLEVLFGKILQIVRDYHIGSAANGSGQNVTVLWIGQLERGDEFLKVFNEAVAHMHIHEGSGALQIVGR